jgi:hypothetical protein
MLERGEQAEMMQSRALPTGLEAFSTESVSWRDIRAAGMRHTSDDLHRISLVHLLVASRPPHGITHHLSA